MMTEMPDPDAIKMFVGQVPKSWNENDVRVYFEEFGLMFLINVLRDKVTRQGRGCCFITYYTRKSALDAQNACHNIRTLPGMNHPIQMKPADNENRHERKIFVGMIPKTFNEPDLRMMFGRFGLIEETSVLRDNGGTSRGCGFITYSSKACAHNAIKTMHQSAIMDGCASPIVVKLADTQRVKDQKVFPISSNPSSALLSPAMVECVAQNAQQYITLLQLLHQQQAMNSTAQAHPPTSISGIPTNSNDLTALGILAGIAAKPVTHQHQTTTTSPSLNLLSSVGTTSSNFGSLGPFSFSALGNLGNISTAQTQNQQVEGPEGSNLFIYHLPQDFQDADLAQSFLGFGTILSAKVFVDKTTNMSKCFGFVSYDNPLSAQIAIQTMNGFQVGSKRLKVQLKRHKDKPY